MNLDTETIDQIAVALSSRIQPVYPVEIDIWSAKEVAGFLKVSPQQVLARYACLPEFPETIRLPSEGQGRGHPRWRAKEIVQWAFSYSENAIGRPRNK